MGTKADPPLHPAPLHGAGHWGHWLPDPQSRAHSRLFSRGGAGSAAPRGSAAQELWQRARWYLGLYLKLLLLPGLLSNFLLSRGNLSPPTSNIFSASWKKGVGEDYQVQRKLLLPKFQKTEHVSRNESWLSSSWTTQGFLKAHSQRFQEPAKYTSVPRRPFPVGIPVGASDQASPPPPAPRRLLCANSKGSLSSSPTCPSQPALVMSRVLPFSLLWPPWSDHFGGFFTAPGLQLYLVTNKPRVFTTA